MSPLPVSVLHLRNQTTFLHDRLETWANVNSGSEHLAGLERMAALLHEACRELTADVRLLPVGSEGRVIVHARIRPDAPLRLLCSGHYDTVYGSESSFQQCRKLDADLLQGPGVADMKGGIVVMLAALRAFEATPHAERLGWDIVLTPDEEIGSTASRSVLEELAPRFRLGLVFEPARETGDLVHTRKGTGIFRLRCHGRSAHAGRDPAAGRNAILALCEWLLLLQRHVLEQPGILLNVGRIEGGGTVNVVPDQAWADVNARCGSKADADAFLALLRSTAATIDARDGFRTETVGQFNRWPTEPTPQGDASFDGLRSAAADLGLKPLSRIHVGGGSDGNLLQAAGLPCVDGLGPVGGHLHSDREYVHLSSLGERGAMTALFLHRLASGAIQLP